MCRLAYCVLVVFGCGFSRHVQAATATPVRAGSSPNPVGAGARALGQGNAFIAVADDATAASWNPAGLSQLWRPEFSFALEALSRSEDNSSTAQPGVETHNRLRLEELNYASVVLPALVRRNIVLSLNYLRQYSFDRQFRFPVNLVAGAFTTTSSVDFEQDGALSVVAPAIGIDVTDRLALGLTFNIWNHSLTHSSLYRRKSREDGTFTFAPFPGFTPTDSFSVTTTERLEVDEGYSFVLGAMYRAGRAWTFGAVAKPPFSLHLDRERQSVDLQTVVIPPGLGGTGVPDRRSVADDVDLNFPLILGGGVAWRPSDAWTVAADVTWTQWSEYTEETTAGELNPLTGRPIAEQAPKDAVTARLGVEYLVIGDDVVFPLRCGLGYDPQPSIDGLDDFYTVSAGAGVQVGPFAADAAYEIRWGNDVGGAQGGNTYYRQDIVQHRFLLSAVLYF